MSPTIHELPFLMLWTAPPAAWRCTKYAVWPEEGRGQFLAHSGRYRSR